MTGSVLLDAAGRRRSPATMPGFRRGCWHRNKGRTYPTAPPIVEGIVAVMRCAGEHAYGLGARALTVLLWRWPADQRIPGIGRCRSRRGPRPARRTPREGRSTPRRANRFEWKGHRHNERVRIMVMCRRRHNHQHRHTHAVEMARELQTELPRRSTRLVAARVCGKGQRDRAAPTEPAPEPHA